MGCDMHQRTWIYSKKDRKYLDIHEIDEYDSYCFPPLYTGRYYDLFAVLAGVRGYRLQIPERYVSGYGVPDFASKIFKKMYEECPYHSAIWFYPKDLDDALDDRIELLEGMKIKYKNLKKKYPINWYFHWNDSIDVDSDEYDNDDYVWYDPDDEYLLKTLKDIKEKLQKYIVKDDPDVEWKTKFYDPTKTVICFYFDS